MEAVYSREGPELGQKNSPLKALLLVNLIGIDLAVMTFSGFWLGRAVDRWLHSDPIFLIVGVLSGLAAGIYIIFITIKRFFGEG